eukprot:10180514-Alexandrium_andersonii.AAC.1
MFGQSTTFPTDRSRASSPRAGLVELDDVGVPGQPAQRLDLPQVVDRVFGGWAPLGPLAALQR